MEIPPQRRPKHHGDLSGGRASGLEVVAAWVGNGGDEEVVIAKGGLLEAVDVAYLRYPRGRSAVVLGVGLVFDMVLFLVLAVQHHRPTWRKSGRVLAQFIRLEEKPAEDRCHSQIGAVGQVDRRRCHGGGGWGVFVDRGAV